jgi:putative ABC transport system permease protein
MIPLGYNLRSLVVRKLTAGLTVGGVTLVTFVFAASLMLAKGVERALASAGRDDVAVIVRKGSEAELPSTVTDDAVRVVGSLPGAQRDASGTPASAAEVVVVVSAPKSGAEGRSNVTIRGVDERSRALRPALHLVAGRLPAPGTDEAVVGHRIRGRFQGLDLGGSLELKKNRPLQIVGVIDAGGDAADSEVWADRDIVRAAFGREGIVSSVRVGLTSADAFDAFKHAVESDKRFGLSADRERDFLERQSEGLGLFVQTLGLIVAVLFSAGAMIGATITMHGAVAHRRREIGTLRALGFSRRAILLGFLFEAVTLTATGGLIGVGLSLALSSVEVSMVNYASWSELAFGFFPTPTIVAASLLFAGFIGVTGGFLPALRASRISPLVALRS